MRGTYGPAFGVRPELNTRVRPSISGGRPTLHVSGAAAAFVPGRLLAVAFRARARVWCASGLAVLLAASHRAETL